LCITICNCGTNLGEVQLAVTKKYGVPLLIASSDIGIPIVVEISDQYLLHGRGREHLWSTEHSVALIHHH
jgi:hypothetical protein